jgi:pyruvate kinase
MSLVELEGAKTKIIATLGNPKTIYDKKTGKVSSLYGTYKNGVYDENRVQVGEVTIESLVEGFIRNHADLIRMNVAHHKTEEVKRDFLELKDAILKVERRLAGFLGERRVGVLVDLPGPKIRFQNKFRLPKEYLTVLFDDGKPFPEGSKKAKGLLTAATERSVRINLGMEPFASAAPGATKKILDEVRHRLMSSDTKNPLLAFIGDTECTLEVLEVEGDAQLRCKVIHDGTGGKPLSGQKGFTIRGIKKPIAAFTDEDEEKLALVLAADAESEDRVLTHVGISFCQTFDDVRRALDCMLRQHGGSRVPKNIEAAMLELPDLIAKIETKEGLDNIEEILDFADGVMVARGDLALEMETVEVPAAAKSIIRSANNRGKTVIMATQMLESMQNNLECSRPEAFDVFNAVVDGVDAVMLSGETSSGKYPALAIRKMRRLALEADDYMSKLDENHSHVDKYYQEFTDPNRRKEIQERWMWLVDHYTKQHGVGDISQEQLDNVEHFLALKWARLNDQDSTDRITHAACTMAADVNVEGLVAPTKSGRTARMLARFRPPRLISAQPDSPYTARKLSIVWGTTVAGIVPTWEGMEVDELMEASWKHLDDLLDKAIVFICGTPIGKVGASNVLLRTIVPQSDAESLKSSKKARTKRRAPSRSNAKRSTNGLAGVRDHAKLAVDIKDSSPESQPWMALAGSLDGHSGRELARAVNEAFGREIEV